MKQQLKEITGESQTSGTTKKFDSVIINETLKIYHKEQPLDSDTAYKGNIALYDSGASSWKNIYANGGILYYNENPITNSNNIVSEVNNGFYGSTGVDQSSQLTTSFIAIKGSDQEAGVENYPYINLSGTSGSSGVGFRYKTDTGTIQFKNGAGSWTNLTDGIASSLSLNDLDNTTISAIADKDLLVYDNGTSNWINSKSIGSLTIGGTLTVGSNNIKFNDSAGIIDSNNNELLNFTKVAIAENYINIKNAAGGNDPIISAVGDDTNVGLVLQVKGTESVIVQSDSGSVTLDVNGNLDINGIHLDSVLTTDHTTITSTNSGSPDALTISSADTIVFDISSHGNTNTYYGSIGNGSGTASSGQKLNLIFQNSNEKLRIDFGAGKLGTGGGLARYLTFTTSGQSASLIWLQTLNRWQILNTGATVS